MGNFVDHVKITCKAGNGGNGSMSFHREKFVLNVRRRAAGRTAETAATAAMSAFTPT